MNALEATERICVLVENGQFVATIDKNDKISFAPANQPEQLINPLMVLYVNFEGEVRQLADRTLAAELNINADEASDLLAGMRPVFADGAVGKKRNDIRQKFFGLVQGCEKQSLAQS